jgi:hypothetical protein
MRLLLETKLIAVNSNAGPVDFVVTLGPIARPAPLRVTEKLTREVPAAPQTPERRHGHSVDVKYRSVLCCWPVGSTCTQGSTGVSRWSFLYSGLLIVLDISWTTRRRRAGNLEVGNFISGFPDHARYCTEFFVFIRPANQPPTRSKRQSAPRKTPVR